MLRTGKMSVRIMATIFAVAMTYASFCSTTCGLGVCPNQEQHTAGHDCDNPSHPRSPHHHGSGKSDCSAHYHPSANLVKPDGLQKLIGGGLISTSDLAIETQNASRFSVELSSLFNLGSPPTSTSPPSQRVSVLRI
jgi:hypothetical protein